MIKYAQWVVVVYHSHFLGGKIKLIKSVTFQGRKIRKPAESENKFKFSDSKLKSLPAIFSFSLISCMIICTRILVETCQSFGCLTGVYDNYLWSITYQSWPHSQNSKCKYLRKNKFSWFSCRGHCQH